MRLDVVPEPVGERPVKPLRWQTDVAGCMGAKVPAPGHEKGLSGLEKQIISMGFIQKK